MHGFIVAAPVLAFVAALAGAPALGAEPASETNTVSPVDVPSTSFNRIEMVRPDRDPAATVCRYESQPDTHFKKRNCARRRDREALETLEHQHMMLTQRAFCAGGLGGGGDGC